METEISIQPDWEAYIRKNMEILKGWLRYHMILYLQRRNPSVPGISDKLYPPQERKLEKVKKYWKTILGICPICDIYGERRLTERELSIDHFIPWSYVAHDEFWNLHPTTRSINSSKGNRLPAWEKYFVLLNRQEYLSYQMMWKYESVRVEFEKCAREHLNSDDIRQRLNNAASLQVRSAGTNPESNMANFLKRGTPPSPARSTHTFPFPIALLFLTHYVSYHQKKFFRPIPERAPMPTQASA